IDFTLYKRCGKSFVDSLFHLLNLLPRVEIHYPKEANEWEDKSDGPVDKKDRPFRFRLNRTRRCAYIQDVSYHTAQPGENERELTERQNVLVQQVAKANRKYHMLQTRFQRLSTQQELLESFANSFLTRSLRKPDCGESDGELLSARHSRSTGRAKRLPWVARSLSRKKKMEKNSSILTSGEMNSHPLHFTGSEMLQLTHIEAVRNFFSLYNAQTQQLDKDAAEVGEELDQTRGELDMLGEQLRQLNRCQDEFVSKELHVLLESKGNEAPQLELSYSVGGVSWTPLYDIRLSSATATLQPSFSLPLKVIYYGLISQSTGENWDLGKLTLSTAKPMEGGGMPELQLERIALKEVESSRDSYRRRGQADRYSRNLKARSFHAEEAYPDRLLASDEVERCFADGPLLTNSYRGTLNSNTHPSNLESSLYLTKEGKQWSIPTPVGSMQLTGPRRVSFISIIIHPFLTPYHQLSPTLQLGSVSVNVEQEIISGIERSRNQTLLKHNIQAEQTNFTTPTDEIFALPCPLFSGGRRLAVRTLDPFTWLNSGASGTSAPACTISSNDSQFQSLTFEVEHPPSLIRGTGEPHRVKLGELEFRPILEYITIPKLLPKAFLRARMHNTSEFALLEGPANVYIDNCFNGQTQIPATIVQEELVCNLGVDSGVHITYKPRHKYKKAGSHIGGKTISITFTQIICITNTYPRSLCILVIDQLPVCTEDKVKVQLLEPAIKHPDKYDRSKPVRINKLKMIEWDVKLGPCESTSVCIC
ncbi:hypothetical protein FBUS_01399, partial [Fasciolopsis buskii]